jgi:uncharacterized protein
MLQTDLSKIKYYGIKNEKKNWQFRTFLKSLDKDEVEIDATVHHVYADVIKHIDCTQCANCCKEMRPVVTKDDICSISKQLRLPEDKFISKYLEVSEDNKVYLIAKKSCPFLKGNRCSIYEVRPEVCRSFPHLWKEGFLSRLINVVENYSICPIVFNVYEQLKSDLPQQLSKRCLQHPL